MRGEASYKSYSNEGFIGKRLISLGMDCDGVFLKYVKQVTF
jgi:hypothetical protein